MRTAIAFMTVLVVVAFLSASATIINIPDDYATIQDGIDASIDGDTVLVQPGTYIENINFNGRDIILGSLFLTTGDTSIIEQTVIDGDQQGSVVTFESGETVNSVIEGFTITNGSGTFFDPYWEYGGGGIYCNASAPTIRHNIITGNTANNGGGIGVVYTSPVVITHNRIFENSANVTPGRIGGGGGMAIAYSSDAEVSHNDIYSNYSGKAGGGMAIGFDCNPEVMCNTIRDNTANDYGGGIQIYSNVGGTFENNVVTRNSSLGSNGAGGVSCRLGSYSVIANNIIFDNSAATYGGGIRCFNDATPTITNNLISGNDAGISGGGLECDVGAIVTAMNTILWNNDAPDGTEIWIGQRSGSSAELTISYSDVEGGMASVYVEPGSILNWGAGMIDNDPLLRDPGAGDFHLMAIACGDLTDSPCIDAGSPTIADSLIDCSWGLGGTRSDMGACGGGAEGTDCVYTPGDCNHNGVPLELGDVVSMIGMYRGTAEPGYTCDCPPHGDVFAPEADPNGNCVTLELGDVVTEIGAYRGTSEASGCPDCPGSLRLNRGSSGESTVMPPLKSKAHGEERRVSE